jgi:hypothetical protein
MKLSEDGWKYGPKRVAVIKKTNVNNQTGLFWNIFVLTARGSQKRRFSFSVTCFIMLSVTTL